MTPTPSTPAIIREVEMTSDTYAGLVVSTVAIAALAAAWWFA
jgi:hypothetical protein